jgi:hypothetical protein
MNDKDNINYKLRICLRYADILKMKMGGGVCVRDRKRELNSEHCATHGTYLVPTSQ